LKILAKQPIDESLNVGWWALASKQELNRSRRHYSSNYRLYFGTVVSVTLYCD